MKQLTLANLKKGENARIKTLQGDSVILARLRDLGFIPGREVTCIGIAPFGDPKIFALGNGTFALRLQEAQCLVI